MSEELQKFLGPELASLYADGERLLASAGGGFTDYSFVIFPFAKVYEGFLKKLFFQIGAISEAQYNSDHWRVGKALNPQLEKELRHEESVYDRVVSVSGSNALPDRLWEAWKNGRNRVFHYFPGVHKPLSFEEARNIISQLNQAMETALKGCKISSENYGINSH
ncbi:hypothetical protein M1403_03180 [Patescibacteria group bacterium]|nr:hypothetical protein [Patescibacteria group bacterium]